MQIVEDVHKLPVFFEKNTVLKIYKKGKLEYERYYGADGKPYLDIDYTDHGNKIKHPIVPHEHLFLYNENGSFKRTKERRINK